MRLTACGLGPFPPPAFFPFALLLTGKRILVVVVVGGQRR